MDADRKTAGSKVSEEEFQRASECFRTLLGTEGIDNLQPLGPGAVYTSLMTVWLLVYQRLHAGCSMEAAVAEFLELDHPGKPANRRVVEGTLSPKTGSYSRARKRLKLAVTENVAQRIFESLMSTTAPSLADRRVFFLDGTTISLEPTPALKKAFPPAQNQHGSGPRPLLQLLVAHELSSGCALLPEVGPMYGEHALGEAELTKRILPRLPSRSVLIADRNFSIFSVVFPAARKLGHDILTRCVDHRFQALVRQATPLPSEDEARRWRLTWKPSRQDLHNNEELSSQDAVEVWLHEIPVSPELTLRLLTTWEISSKEAAEVYHRRVDVETDIRNVKIVLDMEKLRAKSEEMLRKELATSIIAYNLVVQVRRLAAQIAGVPPRRLSFTGSWTAVRVVLLEGSAQTAEEWYKKFALALRIAAAHKLPNRPGRSYPRDHLKKRIQSAKRASKPKKPPPK